MAEGHREQEQNGLLSCSIEKNKKTGVEKSDCIKVTALFCGEEEEGDSAVELFHFQEC